MLQKKDWPPLISEKMVTADNGTEKPVEDQKLPELTGPAILNISVQGNSKS